MSTKDWRGGGLGVGAWRTGEVGALLIETSSEVFIALEASDFVSIEDGLLLLPAKTKGSGSQDLKCSREDIGDMIAGAAVALN